MQLSIQIDLTQAHEQGVAALEAGRILSELANQLLDEGELRDSYTPSDMDGVSVGNAAVKE